MPSGSFVRALFNVQGLGLSFSVTSTFIAFARPLLAGKSSHTICIKFHTCMHNNFCSIRQQLKSDVAQMSKILYSFENWGSQD